MTLTWPAPPTPELKRTPRSGTDRELLSKRRADLIDTHLRVARQQFEAADYPAAIDQCERAILLDPDEPRAWALLETARGALASAEVSKWLDEARLSLQRGDPEGASAFVARALQIDPASNEIDEVLSAIAEENRRREEELERRALIAAALARAEARLASRDLDSAIRAASEVLIHDPENREAHDLTRRALELSEEKRAREKRHREAQALVDQQRRVFAEGRRREALEALQQFTPPHELVTAALSELSAELVIIERRAREEDERRRQEQAQAEERRLAQLRWVANQMEAARQAADAGRFLDSIDVLQDVQRVDPNASGLAGLLAEARQGQTALEAETRRRQHVLDNLKRAATEFARGRFDDAVSLVDAALALEPGHADAIALRRRVEEAIETERRQRAIDRQVEILVEQARRRFEAGDQVEALAMLESAMPHPFAAKAQEQLQARFDEIERQRDAERRRREAAIRKGLESAHQAFVRHDLDRALRDLDDAARLDPESPQIAALRARVVAEVEEARRREELERRARAAVAEARRKFASGDRVSAIASLEQFDPPHTHVSDGLTALRAELVTLERREHQEQETARRRSEERVRKEASTHLKKARSCLTRKQPEEAIRSLEAFKQHVPPGSMSSALEADIESVIAAARVQVKARETAEQEVRTRQLTMAAALQSAKAAESARSAISILTDALDLDPTNVACRDLLSARLAEVMSYADRLIDEQHFDLATEVLEGLESFDSTEPELAALRARALGRRSKSGPIRPGDELTIVEPRPSGTLDTADIPIARQPTMPEAAAASQAVPLTPSPTWKAIAAAALVIGMAGAGVVWKVVSQSDQTPDRPAKAIPTTSIPQMAATTTIQPLPPVQPVDAMLEKLVADIRTQLGQKNLTAAAELLGAGLRRAPIDPRLAELSRDVIRAASARANDAKRLAERSGGMERPQYADGMKHLETASRLAKSPRVDTAVDEYITAAQLFEQAAQPVQIVERQLTSIPTTVATTSMPPAPATTTTPSVVVVPPPPPVIVAPTPTTAPPPMVRTIEEVTAKQLLDAFTAAYQTFDAARLRQIFPGLTRTGQLTLESDKKNFSSCDYRFANLRISGSATTARVDADGIKTCKPKTGQKPLSTNSHEIFDLNRRADGSWEIVDQLSRF